MLVGLYIFREDEFDDPLYADPEAAEQEEDIWIAGCEAINEALEDDGDLDGVSQVGEYWVAWRVVLRVGISFLAMVTDDVEREQVATYLKNLSRRYLDEVDEPQAPEKEGVADVVVDVIPPWEE